MRRRGLFGLMGAAAVTLPFVAVTTVQATENVETDQRIGVKLRRYGVVPGDDRLVVQFNNGSVFFRVWHGTTLHLLDMNAEDRQRVVWIETPGFDAGRELGQQEGYEEGFLDGQAAGG